MTESPPVVALEGVSKIYPSQGENVVALDNVDLIIKRGAFASIIGPSGSGKSTLMHILGCLDHPTSGRYLLEGDDVSRRSPRDLAGIRARRIGFVFQSFNLLPSLTVEENVALPLAYSGQSNARGRVRELLEKVGLGHRLTHRPVALSGGERQRVAVARALVNDPAIIFADEPTGNLDSRNSEIVIDLLEELNGLGNTIVLVTHEDEVAARTRQVIEIRDGRVAEAVVA